jgi:hypothetical protein
MKSKEMLEEETAGKPSVGGLALDIGLVGADQVAFHSPGSDEPAQPLEGGIRRRKALLRSLL